MAKIKIEIFSMNRIALELHVKTKIKRLKKAHNITRLCVYPIFELDIDSILRPEYTLCVQYVVF